MNRRERRAVARQVIKRRDPSGQRGRVSGAFVQQARRDFAAALKVDHAGIEAPAEKRRWSRLWTPQDARGVQ